MDGRLNRIVTKRVILEIYDEVRRAMGSGAAYQTRLDPPTANGWAPPEIEEDGRRGERARFNITGFPTSPGRHAASAGMVR
ncbi:MAG: hypothetical protein L0220_30100 [Acidobacteria bacterium]|nr:hypothetical protein [Acidobacteriota bacterium]